MKVKSESEVAQSCPTLSNPMDSSLPGSSIYGIFQARVLELGAIAEGQKANMVCIKREGYNCRQLGLSLTGDPLKSHRENMPQT